MSLKNIREQIDALDDKVLALLAERANLVDQVAHTKRKNQKATFYDPERERQVLDRLYAKGAGRFPRDAIRVVFREVISACLSLEEPMKVAFLGPEGTFSQMAARHLFGFAARYREAITIEGVFDAVRTGDAECGVVPIENSTEGSVTLTTDALLDGDLKIRQELVLEVAQCLIGRASGLTVITRIYSHPQALAQCRVWLAKNIPSAQIVQTTSTAMAAREAITDEQSAAIGSRLSAELNSVPIIRENIQDRPENATRFFIIGKDDAPVTGDDKTTLAFSIRDDKGALRRVLSIFDENDLNLSRIESRPSRQKRWDYIFLADIEGHRELPAMAGAIEELGRRCEMVKVLGSYPRYRAPTK